MPSPIRTLQPLVPPISEARLAIMDRWIKEDLIPSLQSAPFLKRIMDLLVVLLAIWLKITSMIASLIIAIFNGLKKILTPVNKTEGEEKAS